jgi:hypothetical protein
MAPSPLGVLAAAGARFTYGPLFRTMRRRAIRHHYDVEPDWRKPGERLTSGYQARW